MRTNRLRRWTAAVVSLHVALSGCTTLVETTRSDVRRGDVVRLRGAEIESRFDGHLVDMRRGLFRHTAALQGTVMATDDWTIDVRPAASTETLHVPRRTVEIMELRRDSHHGPLAAAIGGIGGAAFGVLIAGHASGSGNGSSIGTVLGGVMMGGGLGAGVGWLIGSEAAYSSWERIGPRPRGVYSSSTIRLTLSRPL